MYYCIMQHVFNFFIQLILTLLASIEETSMNQIKSIKLYSKLISIEHARMNQVGRHFEDLEYLNTIYIQYSEILFNVTVRGLTKLDPTEIIDVRFGRSTKQIITNQLIITSHYQGTRRIIFFSLQCQRTKLNGL